MSLTDSAYNSVSDVLLGLGMAATLPVIDGEVLFGATLGAWLVTTTRNNFKAWQRIASLILSAGVGYLFTPVALSLAPFLTGGVTAFLCALIVIPISIKIMQWVDGAGLAEIIRHLRGRR
ncbi:MULTISPECIES: putative holin [unclassified Pseudomonas]|uniref:putative holin n=1 Tax=unclassified Pseudomonas TaxID=196821 RepID=UPI000BA43A4E|nr:MULTISPECIES: putative holin [unclassified Pseudomonas]